MVSISILFVSTVLSDSHCKGTMLFTLFKLPFDILRKVFDQSCNLFDKHNLDVAMKVEILFLDFLNYA